MVVGSIVRKHVVEVLECDDFWTQKNVTADRVRNRIELVLDYAAARDWREGPNPAKWKGNLALVLPDRNEVKSENHHAALSHEALPAFMVELRAKEGVAARALEFLILCASRTGEVTGAQRTEIDWDKCIWTIPAARMKIRKNGDHRVPLSVEAVALLKLLPEEKGNPFLFIGERKDGLNHNTMTALLGRMGRKDITIHGFRSTFRDWVADNHPLKRELAERALAHSVNSKTEAAYQRSDQLDLRRPMMQDWANFCGGKTASAKVVQFRATKIAAE